MYGVYQVLLRFVPEELIFVTKISTTPPRAGLPCEDRIGTGENKRHLYKMTHVLARGGPVPIRSSHPPRALAPAHTRL